MHVKKTRWRKHFTQQNKDEEMNRKKDNVMPAEDDNTPNVIFYLYTSNTIGWSKPMTYILLPIFSLTQIYLQGNKTESQKLLEFSRRENMMLDAKRTNAKW